MQARTRIILSAIPLAIFVTYLAWALWLGESGQLPNPVATHWGLGGAPDGFSSLEQHLWFGALSFGISGLIWILLLWYPKIPGMVRLVFLSIAGILFLMLALIQFWVLQIQVGLLDATLARFEIPVPMIFIPIAVMLFVFLAKPKVRLDNGLSVVLRGIPMFKTDFASISDVQEDQASWREFGGLGLRVSKGKVAFLPSSGAVVRIETRAGETILVRSDQAAELASQIRDKLGNK